MRFSKCFFPNTVINFHAIEDPDWMERILLLIGSIYHIISADDLYDYYYHEKPLTNACHITFDDGDRSFFDIVFPLVKKNRIPVSLFVSPMKTINGENFWFQEIRGYQDNLFRNEIIKLYPELNEILSRYSVKDVLKTLPVGKIWNCIDAYQHNMGITRKQSQNISTDELIEIHKSGLVSIGAHTQNHPILNNESDESSMNEIVSSVNELNDMLQFSSRIFAFPNGIPSMDFDNREIRFLKKTSVELAFSTESKGFCKRDNVFSIPRIGLTKGSQAFIVLKMLMRGKWDYAKKLFYGNQELENRKEIIAALKRSN